MTGPFSRIIEAVASIATKLGATVTDSGNRLADNLEGIARVAGGSELPEVTATDNGDVLTVVSGEWAKATPGSGVLVVNPVYGDETITLDKTWQEIHDADYAVVRSVSPGSTDVVFMSIMSVEATNSGYEVVVVRTGIEAGVPPTVVMVPAVFTAPLPLEYPVFSAVQ